MPVDPRITAGLRAQLVRWHGILAAGAERVGWKIGLNVPAVQRQLGITTPVIGHLTSQTLVDATGRHALAAAVRPGIEPEIAIHVGANVAPGGSIDEAREAIEALGAALEVIDLDRPIDDVEALLAGNVFHRAVVLAPPGDRPTVPDGLVARVRREGGEDQAVSVAPALGDPAAVVRFVADLLGTAGERLRAGDRIIAGSLTPPIWVVPGDRVTLSAGALGEATITLVAEEAA